MSGSEVSTAHDSGLRGARALRRFEDAFESELEYLVQRRRQAGAADRDPRRGLVGLALSGGGIRSATVSLGIVQSLKRRGVLDHVDYLSTVGGGGFLGGMLSLTMRDGEPFPFRRQKDGRESPLVTWLRNKSGQLGPEVLWLWLTRFGGWLKNFFVMLPFLIFLSLTTAAFAVFSLSPYYPALPIVGRLPYLFTAVSLAILALLWALARLAEKLFPRKWNASVRAKAASVLVGVAIAAGTVGLVETLSLLLPVHRLTLLFVAASLLVLSLLSSAALMAPVKEVMAKLLLWPAAFLYLGFCLAGVVLLADALFSASYLGPDLFIYGAATGALLCAVVSLLLNGNWGSLLNHLRDRLSKVYLVGIASDQRTEDSEPQEVTLKDIRSLPARLSELGQLSRGATAPYHLINAAINLQGSSDPAVQERGADFFTFSRDHFGGPRIGYADTRDLETKFPSIDLATAVAISASQASPNVGFAESGSERAVGALLNSLRPGYWVPNPRHLASSGAIFKGRLRWRVRPWALFKEILGRFDENQRWVNVGSGEPLDSLGIYELLRRRCRFIIVGDAELDPEMTFSSLTRVIRRARVDLGITIDVKLDPMRPDVDGCSLSHHVFGKIRYPALGKGDEAEEGTLLYVKTCLTGDEGNEILDYRVNYPAFPHEVTAQQRFGEGQFDAYRDLAYHTTEGIFDDLPTQGMEFEALAGWFRKRSDEPQAEEPEKQSVRPEDEERKRRQEQQLAEQFAKNPADQDLGRKLIRLRRQLGMAEEAAAAYDALLHAHPRNADLYEEKANFYRSVGDNDLYLKTLGQANDIREHEAAQHNLGAKIGLSDFRVRDLDFFGDFQWNFSPHVNVLLGKNGYGKSHLLRALVAMLQNDEEVTAEFFNKSGPKARMEISIEKEDRFESSRRSRVNFEKRFGKVPVLAIPDVRFVDRSRNAFTPPPEPLAELSSDGATLFLKQRSYEERLGTFFYDLAFDYFEGGAKKPIFDLLEKSVRQLTESTFKFDRCTRSESRVTFWVRTDGNDKNPLPLQKASQGTMSILAIVGLIYRFLASVYDDANVPAQELVQQRAIVVIDEIDAHLHPSWQQKIMQLLRDSFPQVQFVVTAHSPLVVAGCKNGEVSVLRRPAGAPGDELAPEGFFVDPVDDHFIGATAGEIYRKIFEIEDKDETYRRLTTQFANREKLQRKRDALESKVKRQEDQKLAPEPQDLEEIKQLEDQLFYLREFKNVRSEREKEQDLVAENRSLNTQVLRLQADLQVARRKQAEQSESIEKLATSLPIDFLKANIGKNPKSAPNLDPLIEWLDDRNLVEQASELLQALLEANPKNLDHIERLATFYQEREHYKDALQLWERAAEAAPAKKKRDFQNAADRLRQLVGG